MLYNYAEDVISLAEISASDGDLSSAYRHLRSLPLADFCEVMFTPPPEYRELKGILPSMPPPDVQHRWTGHSGRDLLIKSCNIIRLFQASSFAVRGRGIDGSVLDYGCGWGRLSRLITYFVNPDKVFGIDPMDDSIEACKKHNLKGSFLKIQPFNPGIQKLDVEFDFIFSYSIMTHTSRDATEEILKAARSVVSKDGLFCTTIRPLEFWDNRRASFGHPLVDRLVKEHVSEGYAFHPVGGGVGLDRNHYGDSSFSFDYFSNLALRHGWRVACFDRDMLEPYQVMVSLVPVGQVT